MVHQTIAHSPINGSKNGFPTCFKDTCYFFPGHSFSALYQKRLIAFFCSLFILAAARAFSRFFNSLCLRSAGVSVFFMSTLIIPLIKKNPEDISGLCNSQKDLVTGWDSASRTLPSWTTTQLVVVCCSNCSSIFADFPKAPHFCELVTSPWLLHVTADLSIYFGLYPLGRLLSYHYHLYYSL